MSSQALIQRNTRKAYSALNHSELRILARYNGKKAVACARRSERYAAKHFAIRAATAADLMLEQKEQSSSRFRNKGERHERTRRIPPDCTPNSMYFLNDERIDIEDFLRSNEHLTESERQQIRDLKPGQSLGLCMSGHQAFFEIRCEILDRQARHPGEPQFTRTFARPGI